ncbi:unnamed protein product [Rotaria sp. Silwood1]|nr:unnamed protein product [Rotaria sp. Silwood1]CAF1571444.1 unnamed protein product [Rotaria sp. Silwood1]
MRVRYTVEHFHLVRVRPQPPKKTNPSSSNTPNSSSSGKPLCPICCRDDRVSDVARFSGISSYDSRFMADYYYDFGSSRMSVGKRTGFCFFRPSGADVAFICDVKH